MVFAWFQLADWEYDKMFSFNIVTQSERPEHDKDGKVATRSSTLLMKSIFLGISLRDASMFTEWDLHIAPEILSSNYSLPPNEASDVYSYAILLFEIFNRCDPYEDVMVSVFVKFIPNECVPLMFRSFGPPEVIRMSFFQ